MKALDFICFWKRQKYWFMSYMITAPDQETMKCDIVVTHPFTHIAWCNSNSNYSYRLVNFKRITKKEFELFHSLDNIQSRQINKEALALN